MNGIELESYRMILIAVEISGDNGIKVINMYDPNFTDLLPEYLLTLNREFIAFNAYEYCSEIVLLGDYVDY